MGHSVFRHLLLSPGGSKDTPEAEARRVTYDPSAPFPFKAPRRPSGLPLPPSHYRAAEGEALGAKRPSEAEKDPSSTATATGRVSSERSYSGLRPRDIDPWKSPPWIGSPAMDSAKSMGGIRLLSFRPFSTLADFLPVGVSVNDN